MTLAETFTDWNARAPEDMAFILSSYRATQSRFCDDYSKVNNKRNKTLCVEAHGAGPTAHREVIARPEVNGVPARFSTKPFQ